MERCLLEHRDERARRDWRGLAVDARRLCVDGCDLQGQGQLWLCLCGSSSNAGKTAPQREPLQLAGAQVVPALVGARPSLLARDRTPHLGSTDAPTRRVLGRGRRDFDDAGTILPLHLYPPQNG
jgi:hypothetical protein